MRPNAIAVSSLLILCGVTAFYVFPREALGDRPAVPAVDARADQFELWSPALEKGGSVRLVRRPCDTEKARHLARTGEPAPELIDAGEIRTFGPIPEEKALQLAASMARLADETLTRAEQIEVTGLAEAREQAQEVLHALKAKAAAVALRDGRYWTVERNGHPRLPKQFSYWQTAMVHQLEDGTWVDVFVPIDLRAPDLATTWDALVSLEEELRRDHCRTFNEMPLEERRALCDAARRSAHGEHVEPDVPEWFWKLDVDKATLLATPTALRR